MIGIVHDIGIELLYYENFETLRGIARANPAVHHPADFYNWITGSYASAATMAIRRCDDVSWDSQSLGRMLYEMLEHPDVMTRRAHLALYTSSSNFGHWTFDSIAGVGRQALGPRVIRRDLRRVERACSRIRRYANKRVAHRAGRGAIRRAPEFVDIKKALCELEDVAKTYHTLFTAKSLADLKPVRTYDWRVVFTRAWLSARMLRDL